MLAKRKELKGAQNALAKAEKAYNHTQAAINNYKNTDPSGFNKANNLTYNDKAGISRKVDVIVTSTDITNVDKGSSSFSVGDVNGIIENGAINVEIDNNTKATSDVLAHELGHTIGIAVNPIDYKKALQALPDMLQYNCQDPTNRNNKLSVDALKSQTNFNTNQKMLSKITSFIP